MFLFSLKNAIAESSINVESHSECHSICCKRGHRSARATFLVFSLFSLLDTAFSLSPLPPSLCLMALLCVAARVGDIHTHCALSSPKESTAIINSANSMVWVREIEEDEEEDTILSLFPSFSLFLSLFLPLKCPYPLNAYLLSPWTCRHRSRSSEPT